MKIKSIILGISLCSALSFHVSAQEQYKIKGTLQGIKPEKVFLNHSNGSRNVTDTAKVINGNFEFTGDPIKGGNGIILIPVQKGDEDKPTLNTQVLLFLEPGTIDVFVDQQKQVMRVGGTPTNDIYQKSKNLSDPYDKFLQELEKEFKAAEGNSRAQDSLRTVYVAHSINFQQQIESFVKENPKSQISLLLLRKYCDPQTNTDDAKALFELLDEEVRTSRSGQIYSAVFEELKKVDVGATAPEFTLPDTNEKQVSLSSFRGKYLLVDFWASWCGPCRRENPNVVAAFNKYKNKGFDILGVSLDGGNDARSKWTQAIADDKLSWTQVSDLQGWQSNVSKLYKVSAIPANFLLDPNGKIIAKNLRGEELDQKLAEILK
ncbi:TlpA disulfide reductase family protein [Sphingobacterium sp. DR205]|uniref:TlpA disulfide reductase family protein n=1 Tax=Sphingobacterium sp. DR205 TaxID=2713573 RepID=UPI0013E4611E|nr:TlpA disulfide reductase family protein [Sphingobacterium sp. DR205]QIH35918.1 AhpC/TSA family protein [Sphingobacterium sp. DR205]